MIESDLTGEPVINKVHIHAMRRNEHIANKRAHCEQTNWGGIRKVLVVGCCPSKFTQGSGHSTGPYTWYISRRGT